MDEEGETIQEVMTQRRYNFWVAHLLLVAPKSFASEFNSLLE